MSTIDGYYTSQQIADITNVPVAKIRHWADAGYIPSRRESERGWRLFDLKEAIRAVDRIQQGSSPDGLADLKAEIKDLKKLILEGLKTDKIQQELEEKGWESKYLASQTRSAILELALNAIIGGKNEE